MLDPSVPRSGSVLALAGDPPSAARLQAAFGATLCTFESHASLLEASRRPGIELVIVPWRDRDGSSLAATVSAIRASRQSAPVSIYADRSAECLHALVSLARAGASGVIVRDVDDTVIRLRRLLERGCLTSAIDAVAMAVQRVVPERHRPLLVLCLEHVVDPPTAVEFARRLRVSRRTLSTWARKAGAKGVRSLTSKCRVLVAVEVLRRSSRSLEQVAHELQFASSAHLHNTIRRYTGLAPRRAAERDVIDWCQVLFVCERAPRLVLRLPRKSVVPRGNGSIILTTQPSSRVTGQVPEELMQ